MNKLKILFRGWIEIPHSYACVNCFQLVHFYKKYHNKVDIYVEEMPYFRKEWNQSKKLVYTEEYNNILRNLKRWNGEEVDIVYSITYPYDVNPVVINNKNIPKCVFYTSEFAKLTETFFQIGGSQPKSENDVINHISKQNNMYFTAPSFWSFLGIKLMGVNDKKNRIITHGVDSRIFKKHEDTTMRNKIREFYNVKDTDFLLISIGAMTENKGILLILQLLNHLINKLDKKFYKLLLKGTGDLYQSKMFLEIYVSRLIQQNIMTKEESQVLENHIIFTDKTLSYDRINDLYNAADLYISPYLAEGFNLTPLEALSASLPVLVPETGSTREYMFDLYTHGGMNYINYVKSKVIDVNGLKQNTIDIYDLINTMTEKEQHLINMKVERHNQHQILDAFIKENYSWEKVADLLYDYFNYIKEDSLVIN
jgi:glycosyltransferase involved in cell wall biosynthesis